MTARRRLATCHAVPPHPFLLVYLSERTVVPAHSPARAARDGASISHQTTLPAGSRVGYRSQCASSLFLRVGYSVFAEMESRADAGAGLGTSGGMLWSLDDAGPAARGRGHCPLPPRTRSMRSVQAVDPAEDAGPGQFIGAQAPDVSAETACEAFHKLTAARSLTG